MNNEKITNSFISRAHSADNGHVLDNSFKNNFPPVREMPEKNFARLKKYSLYTEEAEQMTSAAAR
uniref:Uncharacterized protein n=1 Tax=Romanomermis culicivorax TaxID=13658 RepID=A0A915K9V8_ROMCU